MQTGLIAFDVVAKINGISIDIRSISREYAISESEIDVFELLRIVKQCEFKAKLKSLNSETILKDYPFPSIILQKNSAYSVLLKIDKERKRVLLYSVEENKSKDIDKQEKMGYNIRVRFRKFKL